MIRSRNTRSVTSVLGFAGGAAMMEVRKGGWWRGEGGSGGSRESGMKIGREKLGETSIGKA